MRANILIEKELDRLDFEPTVVIGFYPSSLQEKFYSAYQKLTEKFPETTVIGCSSESNIYDTLPYIDVYRDSLCVFLCLDLKKEAFGVSVHSTDEILYSECYPPNQSALILSARYSFELEQSIDNLTHSMGKGEVFGAVASHCVPQRISEATVFFNGNFFKDRFIMLLIDRAFYGISGMSTYHFQPVGFDLEVTEANGNTIYTIDNKPALQLLEEMIGTRLENTIASFNHPLFLTKSKYLSYTTPPLCSIMSIDRKTHSLTLFRKVSQQEKLKVGIALNREKQDAQIEKFASLSYENGVALVFNSVGIERNLEMMEYIYLMDLKKHLNMPIAGFHSFCEIGPLSKEDTSVLHNQTITVISLYPKERG